MEDQRDAILRQRDELAQEIKRRRDAEQKEALQAELAKRRLGPFLRAVWPIVEKKDELQYGPVIDAMALHLEAVEAGRIRNVAISLPPGCLAGDSLVPVLSGSRWRRVAIGQLAADKSLWQSNPPCVPQPDGRGNLVPVRLRDVWPSGVKETFRLRTRTGRMIRGTADHPFMVESAVEPGGRPIFVKLGELVPGDRVCVDADGRVGWEEVTSVCSAGHEPTFDLEVADDPHCFVANGFITHNCTKTKLIMEAFPAWVLGRNPSMKIICVSNSSDLAEKSSLRCRDILKSEWYRKFFPRTVVKDNQDTKMVYGTTEGGYRMAKGMVSKMTGEKFDLLIVDDPNDAEQVLSKANSENVRSWYERVLHNRGTNPMSSCRVAVGQRTARADLIGFMVDQLEFEYVFLPEEFEPARKFESSIGWTDWRTEEGQLLRPERFGPDQVRIERKRPYYRSYHQQDPSSEETAFFKRSYFEHRWRWAFPGSSQIVLPTDDPKGKDYVFDAAACVRFATIDAAASAKTSADYTACVVFCMAPNGHLIVLDCIIRQVDIPDQPLVLAEIHRKHAPPILGIERAGANASMYQFAVRMGFTCVPMEPRGRDKLTRAQAAIMRASKGEIWLPQDGAVHDFDVQDFISELVQFTGIDGNGRDDRCFVAGTMIETDSGDKPIESLVIGDRVLTRRGYRDVVNCGVTDTIGETYRVRMSNGRVIEGTANHPVWVAGRGWVPLGDLKHGDELCPSPSLASRPSSSVVASTGDTRTQSGETIESTTSITANEASRFTTFIGTSGSLPTARSQTDTTFTTSMVTPTTTSYPTSCASLPRNTPHWRRNWEHFRTTQPSSLTLQGCDTSPPHGTPAQKGMSSTVESAGWEGLLQTSLDSTRCASDARSRSLPKGVDLGLAQWLATKLSTEGETISSSSARSVELTSSATSTISESSVTVVGEPVLARKTAVYNLTVDDAHEYFADGVLVHNCDCLSMGNEMMPMLSQVAIGRGARPQSVDPMRGAIRQPPGSVMVPPIGDRHGSTPRPAVRPGMGVSGIPGLVKPSMRFPGR